MAKTLDLRSLFLDEATTRRYACRAAREAAHKMATNNSGKEDDGFADFCEAVVSSNLNLIYSASESPIEKIFWASLANCFAVNNPLGLMLVKMCPGDDFTTGLYQIYPYMRGRLHLRLQPQLRIEGKTIRPDGMMWFPDDPEVRVTIIECDGFEFHSNKTAFISDRKRDRGLQDLGFEVLRYSGSEIHADPAGTATSLAERLLRRRHRVQ